jgi:glycosyl-4,4'-diaponeurosporenoate acyltransferase
LLKKTAFFIKLSIFLHQKEFEIHIKNKHICLTRFFASDTITLKSRNKIEAKMLLYSTIIFYFLAALIGLNVFYVLRSGLALGDMFAWLGIGISIIAIVSIVVSILVRVLPKKVFDPHRLRFKTFKFEKKLFAFLGVKRWKQRIPDAGGITGFRHDLTDPNNPEFVKRFLYENCLSEGVHASSIVGSGICLFMFMPARFILSLALPLFLITFVLHGMPICVQRYVRPKVVRMQDRMVRNIERAQVEADEEVVNAHQ